MSELPVDTSTLKFSDIHDAKVLTTLLSLLFEPTPALQNLLVPSVLLRLTARSTPPATYNELIDICSAVASDWTWEQKAEFIAGHPIIGAPKVGGLSGKEQGAGPSTPRVVLDRLRHLNNMYCTIYPGLRYVTFVNGRPRSAIIPEMEKAIGLEISPEPLPEDFLTTAPGIDSEEVEKMIKTPETEEWKGECERGLGDVWLIGRARLTNLGLE